MDGWINRRDNENSEAHQLQRLRKLKIKNKTWPFEKWVTDKHNQHVSLKPLTATSASEQNDRHQMSVWLWDHLQELTEIWKKSSPVVFRCITENYSFPLPRLINNYHFTHLAIVTGVKRSPLINPGGDLRDGLYHVHPHLHAAVGVVGSRLWQPRHTVVAVSQDLDPQTVVLLSGKNNLFNNRRFTLVGFIMTSLLHTAQLVHLI